jgi:hypothetical protein
MQTQRRSVLKKLFTSLVGVTGLGLIAKAKTNSNDEKEVNGIVYDQDVPLFSQSTKLGNLCLLRDRAHILRAI